MGILKMLLNIGNAEGIREINKIVYKKVILNSYHDNEINMHYLGLVKVLENRYLTFGIKIETRLLWLEVAPFLAIDEQEIALDALVEYIVYKEKPLECRTANLSKLLNDACRKLHDDEKINELLKKAFSVKFEWIKLLDDNIIDLKKISKDETSYKLQVKVDHEDDSMKMLDIAMQKSNINFTVDSNHAFLQMKLVAFYAKDILKSYNYNETDQYYDIYLTLLCCRGIQIVKILMGSYFTNPEEAFWQCFQERWGEISTKYRILSPMFLNKFQFNDIDEEDGMDIYEKFTKSLKNGIEQDNHKVYFEFTKAVKVQVLSALAVKNEISQSNYEWLINNIDSTYFKRKEEPFTTK